jgi:hypothetical protein
MRVDSSYGFQNFVVTPSQYTAGSEQVLYAPLASGVTPGFPSPVFPLSTATNPTAVYVTPSPDIAGSVFDGHSFEIRLAAKFTTAAACSILVNMYQVTNAVLTAGTSSTLYKTLTQASPSGTGITKLVTGTSTAANTTSGTLTFTQQYTWDSVSQLLGINNPAITYQKGVAVSNTQSAATVASLNAVDLNFIPSFTFTTNVPTVFTITEFALVRV